MSAMERADKADKLDTPGAGSSKRVAPEERTALSSGTRALPAVRQPHQPSAVELMRLQHLAGNRAATELVEGANRAAAESPMTISAATQERIDAEAGRGSPLSADLRNE